MYNELGDFQRTKSDFRRHIVRHLGFFDEMDKRIKLKMRYLNSVFSKTLYLTYYNQCCCCCCCCCCLVWTSLFGSGPSAKQSTQAIEANHLAQGWKDYEATQPMRISLFGFLTIQFLVRTRALSFGRRTLYRYFSVPL